MAFSQFEGSKNHRRILVLSLIVENWLNELLKELAQQGVDISHLEFSKPPGGHQNNLARGINNGVRKWEETIVHPDTGMDVIVIPFTFEENFPDKDIIRGFLMDMNSGWFSN